MNENDVAKVYDTVLSIPGMEEIVKLDLRTSRRLVLLLTQVIERGLTVKDEQGLPDVILKKSLEELNTLTAECLAKAGLTDLAQKLKSLQGK